MKDRKSLTKSLHTVTAVTNVAALLRMTPPTGEHYKAPANAVEATRDALRALGQSPDWDDGDPTFDACVRAVHKLLFTQRFY